MQLEAAKKIINELLTVKDDNDNEWKRSQLRELGRRRVLSLSLSLSLSLLSLSLSLSLSRSLALALTLVLAHSLSLPLYAHVRPLSWSLSHPA